MLFYLIKVRRWMDMGSEWFRKVQSGLARFLEYHIYVCKAMRIELQFTPTPFAKSRLQRFSLLCSFFAPMKFESARMTCEL